MALLSPDQSPTTSDTIRFDILTPGAEGCPPTDAAGNNTYKVDRVTIYFAQRDFTDPGADAAYDFPHPNPTLDAAAYAAKLIACQRPTAANMSAAAQAQAYATAATISSTFYYRGVEPIAAFGNPDFPAWLRTTPGESVLSPYVAADGVAAPGHFTLDWSPDAAREGDYFICWTWTPLPAGSQMTSHLPFYLIGDTTITTSIPTHSTSPGKYATLLDEYLPEMFKTYLIPKDLTPDILVKFHAAVAKGFTDVENLANQVIDLLDANVTQEALLPYLGNLFDLKLRSGDPTLWRRQIKNAVPLFKQNGTAAGLGKALAQSGVALAKFTPLWQAVSRYVYTDMHYVVDPTLPFVLSYTPSNTADANFSLLYRRSGTNGYLNLSAAYVSFATSEGVTIMSWLGGSQSPRYAMIAGDLILVRYTVEAIPSGWQPNENYLRALDLADQRDPLKSGGLIVPLKNWNVYVIEEDDPMFSVLVPTRQPYEDDVIFGKIRTEFAYSENIYNMDEYNGSLRDSTSPCNIDASFLDFCGACAGSKYILDVEMRDLCDDRVKETFEIVREFTPFHAIMHRLNASGSVDEFVASPEEDVEMMLTMIQEDNVIAGNANDVFTRWHLDEYTLDGVPWSSIRRNILSQTQTIIASASGVARNASIDLYCADVRLDRLPVSGITRLDILSPSPNSGTYTVSRAGRNTLRVDGVAEPLNQSAFTFRLSNLIYANHSTNLSQSDRFELGGILDYAELGVVSRWDVYNQIGIKSSAWSVTMSYGSFQILDVSPDGNLVLGDPSGLLPTSGASGIHYTIFDDHSNAISASSGNLTCARRGIAQMPDVNLANIDEVVRIGYYLSYSGTQYLVSGLVPGTTDSFYIDGYTGRSAGGVNATIFHRYADGQVGHFNYMGLVLDAGADLETSLGIQNGSNPPAVILDNDHFRESFLVMIDSAYYRIAAINHNVLTLSGSHVDYKVSGTPVSYSVIHMTRSPVNIDGQNFSGIDRGGEDIVSAEIQQTVRAMSALALNSRDANAVSSVVSQIEGVSYKIHYSGDAQGDL